MDELKHRFKGSQWLSLIRDLMLLVFDPDKEFELVISEYKENGACGRITTRGL